MKIKAPEPVLIMLQALTATDAKRKRSIKLCSYKVRRACLKQVICYVARLDPNALLAARDALYQQAKHARPQRWSVDTRNWKPSGPVTLNPERDSVIDAYAADSPINKKLA